MSKQFLACAAPALALAVDDHLETAVWADLTR